MFTAKAGLQVERSVTLKDGLEKVCNDYLNSYFTRTHRKCAETIKEILRELAQLYKQEGEAFKIGCIQFVVQALALYLKAQSSDKFLKALNDFCLNNPRDLNAVELHYAEMKYPVSSLKEYLTTQDLTCQWIQQGRIEEFKRRFEVYSSFNRPGPGSSGAV